jgi:molecular chaperone GrpE
VTQNNETTPRADDDTNPQDSAAKSSAPTDGDTAQKPAETAAASPVDQIAAERDKLKDQLLRTAADFDNFRKRSKRDLDDARQRGKDDIIRDLLPVFDNLERAVQTADTASDLRSVVEGVRMVLKLFEDTAERTGLSRVKSVGERFDPAVHEAIQQQETDAQPPGTIIAEITPGYRFGQRLLRPALVVVARKPEPKPESSPAQSNGSGGPSVPPVDA